MNTQESESAFMRCPSCRSLVPSTARRCRMCGFDLAAHKAGGAQSQPNDDAEQRKSRVRQRTMSVPSNEVEQLQEQVSSPSASDSPFSSLETSQPQAPSQAEVSPSSQSESGSGFRLKADRGIEDIYNKPVKPQAEPTNGQSAASQAPQKQAAPLVSEGGDDDEFIKRIGAAARTLRSSKPHGEQDAEQEVSQKSEPEPQPEQKSVQPQGNGIQLAPPVERSDKPEDSSSGSEEDSRRKRRRRRRKRRDDSENAQQARNSNAAQTQDDIEEDDFDIGDDVEETQESVQVQPVVSAKPQPEVKQQIEPEVKQQQPRKEDTRNSEQVVQAKQKPAGDRKTVKMKSQPSLAEEGELLGWFVHYDDKGKGSATEIISGRFFVCNEQLKPNDMIINDKSISTPHCVVKASFKEGLRVQDLLSEQGTFVKRRDEESFAQYEESVVVEHGDWVRFGEHELLVCLVDTPAKDS